MGADKDVCLHICLLLCMYCMYASLLCCACCQGTMCLLSARHFSLAVVGLRASLSRFLEGALDINIRNECMCVCLYQDRYICCAFKSPSIP